MFSKPYDRLIWKDEGGQGPATFVKANATTIRPAFGAPDPPGVESLGWMTRRKAQAEAKRRGVAFEGM